MRGVVAACVCACVWAVVAADICDRRDRRTDRRWKGDIGDLETLPDGARDRLQLKHRVRRFISFPTGSVLTITPKLTIPWVDELGGYVTGAQLYAFPVDLELPNGTLRLRTNYKDDYMSMDPVSYGSYDSQSRLGRTLDHQRVTGFTFLQELMETVGVAGRACVLRAVCEVAERPVEHLGLTGELINLFFSAGYGGRSPEVEEYVAAEESGRRGGNCEDLYPACPYRLAGMAQSALAYFHQGLATAGDAADSTLFF
ncbi:uncharacterized protein LOC127009662 isoform X2 [Eriocheir sinensis]|nr:uncharacterized protein LOC127009662 isoform X2 [Eriocheir sinensis]XP_050738897.1 uncharacterized protein LOC127009662 isoform X2 [Eriocheir sinensis]